MPVDKNNKEEVITRKHVRKIIYPIIIGLAVVVFLLQREVDVDLFAVITFTWYSAFTKKIATPVPPMALGVMAEENSHSIMTLKH